MYALRQALYAVGFVVSIALFFAGMFAGVPFGFGAMFAALKFSGLTPNIELIPLWGMALSFAVAMLIAGGAVSLMRACITRMSSGAMAASASLVFGLAGLFFLYCAFLPEITTEGSVITGSLFAVCALVAILYPIAARHDAKVQKERHRRLRQAMVGRGRVPPPLSEMGDGFEYLRRAQMHERRTFH